MRLVRLNHVAATGLESRAAGPRTADVGTDDAGTRTTLAGFVGCIAGAQHICAPRRLSLISSAFGMMTSVDSLARPRSALTPLTLWRPVNNASITALLERLHDTIRRSEDGSDSTGSSQSGANSTRNRDWVETASPLERGLTAPARKSVNQGCMSRLGLR